MKSVDRLLQGIEIIKKYEPNPDIGAEHEIIFVGDYEALASQMSEGEKAKMEELGWFEEYESWAIYT